MMRETSLGGRERERERARERQRARDDMGILALDMEHCSIMCVALHRARGDHGLTGLWTHT